MGLFGKKNKIEKLEYDKSEKQPAVKSSICTGEMVAGFIDIKTQKFHDYMLVRNEKELSVFCDRCGVSRDELKRLV